MTDHPISVQKFHDRIGLAFSDPECGQMSVSRCGELHLITIVVHDGEVHFACVLAAQRW